LNYGVFLKDKVKVKLAKMAQPVKVINYKLKLKTKNFDVLYKTSKKYSHLYKLLLNHGFSINKDNFFTYIQILKKGFTKNQALICDILIKRCRLKFK